MDHLLDDEDPWALNLVVRTERDAPVTHTDLLEAAGQAVVLLLDDARADNEWKPSIERWGDLRIRKLCRRARGAKWVATEALEHVEVTRGTACVRAFVPCRVADQPRELANLQLSGTDFVDIGEPKELRESGLMVWVNPGITMTSAKAAVQVAHAAQLVAQRWRTEHGTRFAESGLEVCVVTPDAGRWDDLVARARSDSSLQVIHDAGFTEVAPGSLTAIGFIA